MTRPERMSKAKGVLISLNNAASKDGPPLSADTYTTDHSSPLLRLPGELKNRIFELAIPTDTTSVIRAHSNRTSHGRLFQLRFPEGYLANANRPLRYSLHPVPPGLLATCRELRADALALYYSSNVFFFSDTMYQPRALEAFATARPAAAQHIRRVKVSHEISAMYVFAIGDPDMHRVGRKAHGDVRVRATENYIKWRVTFWAALKAGGVEVSSVRTKEPTHIKYYDGEEEGLCCCTLERMAEEYGCGAAEEAGSVMDMLVKYSGLVNNHDRLVRVRKVEGEEYAPSVGAKLCRRCRKVKAI